jgi:hypothetical protein
MTLPTVPQPEDHPDRIEHLEDVTRDPWDHTAEAIEEYLKENE